MKPQHTPIPWKVENGNDIVASKEGTIACAYGMMVNNKVVHNEECFANAAFIVRAVNTHEELLTGYREMSKTIHYASSHDGYFHTCKEVGCVHAIQAIAKAEAQL